MVCRNKGNGKGLCNKKAAYKIDRIKIKGDKQEK